jgi:hypothetical protein
MPKRAAGKRPCNFPVSLGNKTKKSPRYARGFPIFLAGIFVTLLTRLYMLLVCAASGFTIIAIVGGRRRLRTIVAVLVALLTGLHVLFVRTTLICHDMYSSYW